VTLSSCAQRDRRWVCSAPGMTATVAFFVGLIVAPHLNRAKAVGFASLFATCAQVVAALLVVIAVQVTVITFRGLDLRASDVKTGLAAGCVSVVSAVAALSPSLPNPLYGLLLALAGAGGLGSLVTVVILGVKTIDRARGEAETAALRRRAALGDDAAAAELLAKGEYVPRPVVNPNPSHRAQPPRTGGA